MTEHNLFQEVNDDLERQRLEALWAKYGPALIIGAFLVIIATAAITFYHSYQFDHQQKVTDGLLDILQPEQEDTAKRVQELEFFATKNHGDPQAVIALLRAAQFEAQDNNKDRAAQIYDRVASEASAEPVFRQFGAVMSVKMQMDSGDPKVLLQRLEPLTVTNAPWRDTAIEYQGFLALKAGDKDRARQSFTLLSQDASLPPSVSARAKDMLRYIGD